MKFEFKENLLYLMKSCFPIRCNAEEKANALLKELDRYDIKWYNGVNLLDENYWHKYETETCYKLNLKESDWFLYVCHSNTCEQEGYRVFEFESLLVEVLIENGYKPNDLDEDDEDDYEVLLSLIKREVVECIEEGLSVLLRE